MLSLVSVSLLMALKALPTWVLPDDDNVFIILPEINNNQPQDDQNFWVIVNRPTHRTSLLIVAPFNQDTFLTTGVFPDLQFKDWLAHGQDSVGSYTPSTASQALGLAVDWVAQVPSSVQNRNELLQFVRQQALVALRTGEWDSQWIVLAASMQEGNLVTLTDLDSLPRTLDRADVSLMGGFNACQIAILNATNKNGLAAAIGQVIEQSGGHIIRLDGTTALTLDALRDESDAKVHILIQPEKSAVCQPAQQKLSNLFAAVSLEEDNRIPTRLRADLVLVVGEDVLLEPLFTAAEQYLQK